MSFRNVRQTQKVKKAKQVLSEIYGVKPQYFRNDHAGTLGMYADLAERGYEWISDKQEWAIIGDVTTQEIGERATFVFAVDGVTGAEGQYIVVEGFRAAGYDIEDASLMFDVNNPEAVFIKIVVKL